MKKISLMSLIVAALMLFGSWAFAADTIKVGCAFSLTGDYAGSGDNFFKGVEMAIEELNARGGLLGKQLEILPKEGMMVLFSPSLKHHVTINNSDHMRLSIGFNVRHFAIQ